MPPMEINDERVINQASWVEILYLLNITFLPVIGFITILFLKSKHKPDTHSFIKSHTIQAINASIWAGVLMIGINGLILIFSSIDSIWTWMYIIIYFTSIHSVLIILGVIAISRAQGGRYYKYPWISITCKDPDFVE